MPGTRGILMAELLVTSILAPRTRESTDEMSSADRQARYAKFSNYFHVNERLCHISTFLGAAVM